MSNRIYLIDFFRGLAIINMIIYHTLYDLKYIFYVDMPFFSMSKWYFYQQYICVSFIFLSGFSSNFSKKLLKNALKLSVIACFITIVTTMVSNELAIYFGIIHFLAFSMFFITIVDRLYERRNRYIDIIIFIIVFCIFIYLKSSYFFKSSIYTDIYSVMHKLPLSFIYGFPKDDFYSADYFPIIPWIFLFLSGYFAGRYYKYKIKKDSIVENLDKEKYTSSNIVFNKISDFIIYLSRHSLIIYVLHQIVIYAILYLLFKIV